MLNTFGVLLPRKSEGALGSNKTLGGVGALLMVISPLLRVYSWLLGLVGIILVLVAVKGLSDYYKDKGMFDNALYGTIIAVIGLAVFVPVIWVAVHGLFSDVGVAWGDWSAFRNIHWQTVSWNAISLHALTIIGSLIAIFVFFVVAAIFFRRSLNALSAKTGVSMFSTAGLLALIGAVLTIIGVGFLILWIALILLTVAFFSIKT
jgi:uncharacterized membrane protein